MPANKKKIDIRPMTQDEKKLFEENKNLVHYIMNTKFSSVTPNHVDYEDLVQTGYYALCLACERYKDDEAKFSTFAHLYCFGHMMRYRYRNSTGTITKNKRTGKWNDTEATVSMNVITEEGSELGEMLADDYDEFLYCETYEDLKRAFEAISPTNGLTIFNELTKGQGVKNVAKELGYTRAYIYYEIKKAKEKYYEKENKYGKGI